MKSGSKYGLLIFLTLLGGILIGLSIAWNTQDQNSRDNSSSSSTYNPIPVNKNGSTVDEDKINSAIRELNQTIDEIDHSAAIRVERDTAIGAELDSTLIPTIMTDSTFGHSPSHEKSADTSLSEDRYEENSPVILKSNKLLLALQVQEEDSTVSSSVDSILQAEAKINNNPTEYRVEFWTSPVQFKGYKFMNRKILLYGVPPTEQVHIQNLADTLIITCDTTRYKLVESYDSRGFIP